jgi:hypothetical protein
MDSMPIEEKEYRLSDKEVNDHLCTGLLNQSKLIWQAGTRDIPGRAQELNVLILTSAKTISIISDLGKASHLSEAVMLARSVIERCVNYCYLLYCDEDEYERFWQYSHQKMYRRLSSSVEAAGYRFEFDGSRHIDLDENPKLKEDIDAFTSSRGKEKTRWTKTSIIDRVHLFCSKSGVNPLPFLLNMLWVYDDASEALHGTFYGCAFDSGVLPTQKEIKVQRKEGDYKREQISLLAIGLHDVLHSVMEVINKNYDLGELFSCSEERKDKLHQILTIMLTRNE